jgi:hypothetical protein
MADFNTLSTAFDTPPFRPTAPRPPTIAEFIREFLTDGEIAQLERQFISSCQPNRQVMWTGMLLAEAQEWADRSDMQTLSTAMGPLRKRDGKKRQTIYMRGASAEFARYITKTSHVVTLLCPPPPDRFNPKGGTNMQLVEMPILTGIIGDHAVSRIDVIHPAVRDAEDFKYQLWPSDQSDIWLENFAQNVEGMTQWPRRARKANVLRIENMLRWILSGLEEMPIFQEILPRDTAPSAAVTWRAETMATNTTSTNNREKTGKKMKKETKETQPTQTAPKVPLKVGPKSRKKTKTTAMNTASTTKTRKKAKKKTKEKTKEKTEKTEKTKKTEKKTEKKAKVKRNEKSKEKTKKIEKKTEKKTKGKIGKGAKVMRKDKTKEKIKETQPTQTTPKAPQGLEDGLKTKRKTVLRRMDMRTLRMSSPGQVDNLGKHGNESVGSVRGFWIVVFVSVVETGFISLVASSKEERIVIIIIIIIIICLSQPFLAIGD